MNNKFYLILDAQSQTALIIGLVVGLGGSVIVILTIIAVVVVFCKRQKHREYL